MGLPCTFAVSRCAGREDRTTQAVRQADPREAAAGAVRQLQRAHVPGRGAAARGDATSRRRSPARSSAATPARRSWAMPARPTSSRKSATRCSTRCSTSCRSAPSWTGSSRRRRGSSARVGRGTTTRKAAARRIVEREPVLVRISAAKRLRDRAERDARRAGEERVTAERAVRSRSPESRGMTRRRSEFARHGAATVPRGHSAAADAAAGARRALPAIVRANWRRRTIDADE